MSIFPSSIIIIKSISRGKGAPHGFPVFSWKNNLVFTTAVSKQFSRLDRPGWLHLWKTGIWHWESIFGSPIMRLWWVPRNNAKFTTKRQKYAVKSAFCRKFGVPHRFRPFSSCSGDVRRSTNWQPMMLPILVFKFFHFYFFLFFYYIYFLFLHEWLYY